MSRETMLNAIRRGLRRGPLPPDQAEMLRGRLASHPRQLIPARSRLPHAEQVVLFVQNVEKEFGSVARVADADALHRACAEQSTNDEAGKRAQAQEQCPRPTRGRNVRQCVTAE